jgi:FAD/FMN-containing dehydrogenase
MNPANDLRQIFRGTVDEPAEGLLVAEPLSSLDVRAAVIAAGVHGLPLAVYATGHGTPAPHEHGLVLKTSRMAEVLIDPDRRVATIGPGARWRDVIAAAAPFGLAPISGSSTDVGVAGYTLGGGLGWLSRRYGFAADSLLRADVVVGDGDLLTACEDRNADLFWALRGGGPSFGVVTRLDIRLHPVSRVYGGIAYFPIERAAETIARFRDWTDQPDELMASVVLMRDAPEGLDGPVLAIRGVYAGDARSGARALQPLLDAAGTPVAPRFREMAYAETGTIGGTAPLSFERFADLPDALIETAVELIDGDAAAVEVRRWGGAMARPGGPVGHRDVPFSLTIEGDATAVRPYATGGTFLNFVRDPARVRDAFDPADYDRLVEVKRIYDPENLFSAGRAIAPGALAAAA